VGSSWEGLNPAGNPVSLAPPDPTGAIGPSSYIELINLQYGIYGRDGSIVNHGDLGAFTGLPVTELSDPQIVWDPGAQRFYYVVLDTTRYGFAFGYSLTANPQSPADFCRYILNFGYGSTLSLPDYPKMAVTQDFVLIGVNVFFFASIYNGSDLNWLYKPPPDSCPSSIDGGKFSQLRNADGSYTSTPVPAVNADPTSTGWVVGTQDPGTGSGAVLSVFRVTKQGNGTPAVSPAMAIGVPGYSVPADAPQPGTSATLDTMDSRLKHAVAGVDPSLGTNVTAIWTSHTVLGGAGAEERWYEINTNGTPSLAQSGRASSASLFAFNGGISPDRANDGTSGAYGASMVMGFNTSSPNQYSAVQMVSKKPGSGQSDFVLVKQSAGANVDFSCGPTCRWGDYSGATPDPLIGSGGRVWLSGEWNRPSVDGSAPTWATWNWSAAP
jgi:hypothetical protein